MLNSFLKLVHAPIYQHRLNVLVKLVQPHLRPNDSVLDVGCGSGMLGKAVLRDPSTPGGITYMGVEKNPRGGEPIEVVAYDGDHLPFEDGSIDVVLIADVLHHEANPLHLLTDASRVSRRLVVVKDHKIDGLLAQWRVSFLDWAANEPHGVTCLYQYPTLQGWRELFESADLQIESEQIDINLYPPIFNAIFGRRLQYFACMSK